MGYCIVDIFSLAAFRFPSSWANLLLFLHIDIIYRNISALPWTLIRNWIAQDININSIILTALFNRGFY